MNSIIKKHWRYLAMAILISTVASLTAVFVQFEKGRVLDFALARQAPEAFRSGVILLALILLELATYYAYNIFSSKFFLNGVKSLREAFFAAVFRRKYPDFQSKAQGEYLAMYTDQIEKMQKQYIENIIWMFEISIKALSVSIGLFVLDWRLALITLFLLTTPLYMPKLVEQKLQKAQKESAKVFEAHLAIFTDWLSSFELIKNFSIENKILAKFRESNALVYAIDYRRQILNYRFWLISSSLSYLSHFIIIAFAGALVLRGDFSAGQFFVAIGMIDQLSMPILALSVYMQNFVAIKPVREDLEKFISYKPKQRPNKTLAPEIRWQVEFQDVVFSYTPEKPLLSHFNLKASSPGHILLTGPNGSGKSTSMSLLLNYYDAQKGTVSINNTSVNEITYLQQLITVMRQDATFFEDSLRENLRVYQDLPDSELINMLKRVGLEKWANKTGLDMPLQSGATNLSGGERRRIALARALLRDAPILILDEPLANIDQNSQTVIEELIKNIDDKLVFLISHQLTGKMAQSFNQVIHFGD
jgi:ABC-type multidrug transport system fused ATPase/permease subunit